jgi:hypothetical protein
MKRLVISGVLEIVALGLLLPVMAPANALAGQFSGRAFGAIIHVGSIDTTVCDSGELPSSGGSLETILQDVRVDSVLTAGAMRAETHSTSAVFSHAYTVELSVLPGTPAALTADAVPATVIVSCDSYVIELAFMHLVFGGVPIRVTGINQTVVLPGVATLIINEFVRSTTPDGSEITMTGLHLTLADGGEILVSRAHAAIRDCATVTVQPTSWSEVKGFYH